MKKIVVLITCFFLTLSIATDSYAAKGFKKFPPCKICKKISELVETKLQEMFEIIQTKILNTFDWIDEKLNWNLLTVNTFKKSGKQVGIECDEYELCCSEPLDNFCQDLREKHTFGGNIVRAGQVD